MSTTLPPSANRTPSGLILAGILVVCYSIGSAAAYFTASEIPTWYAGLAKPAFNPPNWVFAPVWTALYGLMALAAWLVWRTPRFGPGALPRRKGLILFAIQLTLNALWPPVFFHLHQIGAALAVILLLWIAILLTILSFWKIERYAAALMIAYLVWVTFATALNYAILRLN